jgi:flagella basal body P-ring formation protein FlgA
VIAVKNTRPCSITRVRSRARRAVATVALAWPALLLAQAAPAPPEGGLDADTLQQIQALGQQAGAGMAPGAVRVEIEPGRLDPRLRLAPCERIEAFLPPGARAWGRTRVGLRCAQGPTPWNVYLPVTLKPLPRATSCTVSPELNHWRCFSVTGEGQALSAGIEGQTVRVRIENGRVLSGLAVGNHRVEVQL